MGSSEHIAIVGIGAVSPFGWGIPSLLEGLYGGRTAIGPIDRFDASRHRTHLAAQVPAAPASLRFPRRTSLADRYALAAAREAIARAGLAAEAMGPACGVFFGSSTGGLLESEEWFERFPGGRARDSLLAAQQFSAPGDAVARALRVSGPVETISAACASGAMAIGRALDALRSGEVTLALAGGSDSLCRLTYAGFNALRSVDEAACRPFRRDRTGLSLGEGAAVLVLEPLDRARERGATPLAILAGAGESCDAHHMTAPDPAGNGAERAIRAALASGGIGPEAIAFVNAHGTGTPHNDASEAAALHAVFGDRGRTIPVTSTKSLVGHLLGSAGALEAVATAIDLENRTVHPMPVGGEADPSLDLDLVLGSPRAVPSATHALSTNLAFGGANAALVLARAETAP
jgi:3-oxoacyl-[acyl-carrier-protein] synthase II